MMRNPIILEGHERAITQIKFNNEGDLIFSCSKDHAINVWSTDTGERMGRYVGHTGTVWSCDIDFQSRYMVTGAADNEIRLWEVGYCRCVYTWRFQTPVKWVAFDAQGKRVMCVTEERMGHAGTVQVFDIDRQDATQQRDEPSHRWTPKGGKATVCAFASSLPGSTRILTGHASGNLVLSDIETGLELSSASTHSDRVTDLQLDADRSVLVTSSADGSAQVHDTSSLKLLKSIQIGIPVHSAALIPHQTYVLLSGGLSSMNCIAPSRPPAIFDTRIWDMQREEEVQRVKGHWVRIESIATHPSGSMFALGGEDGLVRLHLSL